MSGSCSPVNGVGTAMMKASDGSGLSVARSLPAETAACTTMSRSGSTMWILPVLMTSTMRCATSTPITSNPRLANAPATGKPTEPRPRTEMRFVEGLSNAAFSVSSVSGMVEILKNRDDDAFARLSIAIRIVNCGHGIIVAGVFDQSHSRRDDGVGIGADELDGAGRHRFRPFGDRPHHEHRLAQRRGLLLHAATVGQDEIALGLRIYKIEVIQRLDQFHVR